MLRIFIGIDDRQPVAAHVLTHSIQRLSSQPVSITPLILNQLPISRRGLTDFTFSRYLVPWLCSFEGKALFMDSDMLVMSDIAELFDLAFDGDVGVVPFEGSHAYERPSLMMFNNEQCGDLTPHYIESGEPQTFQWAEHISALPNEWNYLVGYQSGGGAKLAHYTQGVPGYKECRNCEYSKEWHEELARMTHIVSWLEVMGGSVHMPHVIARIRNDQ